MNKIDILLLIVISANLWSFIIITLYFLFLYIINRIREIYVHRNDLNLNLRIYQKYINDSSRIEQNIRIENDISNTFNSLLEDMDKIIPEQLKLNNKFDNKFSVENTIRLFRIYHRLIRIVKNYKSYLSRMLDDYSKSIISEISREEL
jgi:hypothetical protein